MSAECGSVTGSELALQFDEAWKEWKGRRRPDPPLIEDFLPHEPGGDRLAALLDLIKVDFDRRLAAGESVRVEDYLRRYPELSELSGGVTELIGLEISLLKTQGIAPAPDEYWPPVSGVPGGP